MNDSPPPEFDAWGEEAESVPTPPPRGRSTRTIGVLLIVGVFVALVCLLGVMIAMNAGFVRPSLQRVADSTATAEAGATARIVATADYWEDLATTPDDWRVLLEERFDNSRRWELGLEESTYGTSDVSIEDVLRWEVTTEQGIFTQRSPQFVTGNGSSLTDFLVSVEATAVEYNEAGGSFGIIFRQSGPYHYVFLVSTEGYFTLLYRDQDGWESVMEWTRLPAYVGTMPYKLTVRGEGDKFWFFINDQFLTHVVDDRKGYGRIGLSVSLEAEDKRMVVEFDNLMLYVPPEGPTRTPEPTATIDADAPSATATATPTAIPVGRPMIGLPGGWLPVFGEAFPTDDTYWDQPSLLMGDGEARTSVSGGKVVWGVSGNADSTFYTLLQGEIAGSDLAASDGYLQATFSGADLLRAGLIFRHLNGAAYVFEIDRHNTARVLLVGRDDSVTVLFGETVLSVDRYTENTIGVLARGDKFALYYHGALIGKFEDSTLSEGEWGLSVSVMPTLESGTMKFDDVVFYTP